MNIKDYSQKEMELLKQIKKNYISSLYGLSKSLCFMWVMTICISIGAYCSSHDISVPYGAELIQIAMLGSIGVSIHYLWTIVSLDNQFIRAMAERTGLKVIEEYTLICEGDYPQLYDEKNKIYYRVRAGREGVFVKEIKHL